MGSTVGLRVMRNNTLLTNLLSIFKLSTVESNQCYGYSENIFSPYLILYLLHASRLVYFHLQTIIEHTIIKIWLRLLWSNRQFAQNQKSKKNLLFNYYCYSIANLHRKIELFTQKYIQLAVNTQYN